MASVTSRQYRTNVIGAEPLFRVITDTASVGNFMLATSTKAPAGGFNLGLLEFTHTVQVRGLTTPMGLAITSGGAGVDKGKQTG